MAFNSAKEQWTAYAERLNYYFIANGVKEDVQNRATLLSVCGPDTYKTIRSIIDTETLEKTSCENLIKMLQAHYDPKPSFIVQRVKFYQRTRELNETVAQFVAALREIAEHCEYKDNLQEMIRDRLVCGINHDGIQKRLLTEKDLPYAKALEIALAMETAEKGNKELKAATTVSHDVHYTSPRPIPSTSMVDPGKQQKMTTPCDRCLGKHSPASCKHRITECLACKKVEHLARACKTKKNNDQLKAQTNTRKNHYMREEGEVPPQETSDQERSYDLFTLQASGRNPITVQVDLNQVPTEMEIDTGASISLINRDTYEVISKQSQIEPLQKTDVKLKTYTGEAVQILGTAHVDAKYGEVEHKLIIHVVDGKGPNLLGRD